MTAVESLTVQAEIGARPVSVAPVRARKRRGVRRRVGDVVYGALAVVVFVFSVFPVYWMLNTSFLPNRLIRGADLYFFPTPDVFTLANYRTAIFDESRAAFIPALWNSLGVAAITVVVAMALGFVASLALTRFSFKGKRTFIVLILVVQMLPGEALFVSIFRIVDSWQLLNTIVGLSVVNIAAVLPFTIWTLRGFVNGVPAELEEAAMIDGCSRAGAFWRITFPLLAPGLVATGVFALIQAWNEFVIALIIMQRPDSMTLPVWLRTFQQATQATNWGAMMAGATLIALPVVIFFLLVNNRMTGGLVSGAVKG